jgi:hypothetical protein
VGCYHDKFNISGPKREDYEIPPDQPRYNLPDTAPYKAPPPPKQVDTLMGGRGGGNSPIGSGPGGF